MNDHDSFHCRLRNGVLAVAAACFVYFLAPGTGMAADDESNGAPDVSVSDLPDVYGRSYDAREQMAASHSRRQSSVNPNHDYTINFRVAPWLAQPGGRATLGSLGTDVDLQDDLGFDEYKIAPAGSANLRLGRHDLWVDALLVNTSASDTVSQTITFGSLTIPVNRGVRSDVDLKMYDIRYGYSFFDQDRHGFRLGPTLGVAYVDLDVKITDQVTGSSDSLSGSFPMPRLGLQGSVPVGPFELAAKVAGLYVEYNDFKGYTLEGDVSVTWRPFRNVGLAAGYRAIKTDIEYKNDKFDLIFQGPYLGAELRF